ncbi:MAG: MFS transporter [Deltaproteobacteria bacterium]|nr:MFS transporter [Deltaproteobacteria bacterium]MBW2664951.1 MFS transporter [Deltaproteobacteria bacterium]
MPQTERTRPVSEKRRLFFGWRMVAVAFVVDFIAVGFFFYSYGIFLKGISADLAGSRFAASLGISIANGIGALFSPFIGRALDRLSIKLIMIAGALLVGTGFFALSLTTAMWQFYAVMGTLLAFGMSMMGGLASAKLVANWFEKKRGKALGIATIGVSFSGLIMPPFATWLVYELGWRGGFQVYAVLTIAITVPLVAAFVVNRPEDKGLLPDGGMREPHPPLREVPRDVHWRTRELLRDRNFWAIAIPFGLAFSSLSAVLIHLVPYASDLGIANRQAAWIVSAAAGAGALGKPVFGHMIDRFDARITVCISFGGQLLGLLLLMRGGGFESVLAAAMVFGFSMGGVVPIHGAVTATAFGRLSFGKAMGLLRPVQIPIHMLGVPLAGWIFDSTGSYRIAFQIFAGFYVVAIAAAAMLRLGIENPQRGADSDGETRSA